MKAIWKRVLAWWRKRFPAKPKTIKIPLKPLKRAKSARTKAKKPSYGIRVRNPKTGVTSKMITAHGPGTAMEHDRKKRFQLKARKVLSGRGR